MIKISFEEYFKSNTEITREEAMNYALKNTTNALKEVALNKNYDYFSRENNIREDLIKASKNGVKITVLFDNKKTKKDDEILDLLKENGIKTIINKDKNKMHLKIALIDSKIAIIGSTNWTEESFEENYDLIYITDDKKVITKLVELKEIFNNW